MAKKKTALQKRREREKERARRKAYESGKVAPAKPKGKSARRKAAEAERQLQKQKTAYRKRSAAETAQLNREDLAAEVQNLWNDAYHKYRALKDAGISNAATALYEDQFAGMNPWENTVNKNRALAAMLRKWLHRKDTSVTRGKKNKKKMKDRFFKDFDEMFEEDGEDDVMREFWETWEMFVEWLGGIPAEFVQYLEIFTECYLEWKQNPDMSQEEFFQNAKTKIMQAYAESYTSDRPFTNPLDV